MTSSHFYIGQRMSSRARSSPSAPTKRPRAVKMVLNHRKRVKNNLFAVTEEQDEEAPTSQQSAIDFDVDPLDAYMAQLLEKVDSEPVQGKHSGEILEEQVYSESDFKDFVADDQFSWLTKKQKTMKKKEIKPVDHSKFNYPSFTKDFYIEAPEIAEMTEQEVDIFREEHLEGVTIRGKGCPKPIQKWTQCGLTKKVLNVIDKSGFTAPFPIQSQAIPAIMSGRDVMGCAKTGSGKSLAFVLPMLRHILDQPPISSGDGPIALILAPTRELAIQLGTEVRRFGKALGLRSACCYGGTGVAEQIAVLKKGAEVLIATPGRMIDMLCANQGRVTNLARVTFLVLDEADRMFDMGFEPQISAILSNVRPDRQTVMFSATFPKQIEGLAKKALRRPIQIMIGSRSAASNTVEQFVEVLDPSAKFRRLLQLLGEWYDKGCVLIFEDRQEAVDSLFAQLMKAGYPCFALHGGMEQSDRDYTVLDFKKKIRRVMVATSVAARGLDVKDLVLVVNYTAPNHYEDYIHKIGRTGRAGASGTAYTFIQPDEAASAPDLVRALKSSNTDVPTQLQLMADEFEYKVAAGVILHAGHSGYDTKGFKFDEQESRKSLEEVERQKKVLGIVDEEESSDEELELSDQDVPETVSEPPAEAPKSIMEQLQLAKRLAAISKASLESENDEAAKKKAKEESERLKKELESSQVLLESEESVMEFVSGDQDHFCDEIEINDYPQKARWNVTHKGSLTGIQEWCDVAITARGSFIQSGRKAQAGDRKLHLYIEGKSKASVSRAKKEIRRILEESTSEAAPEQNSYAKYSVL